MQGGRYQVLCNAHSINLHCTSMPEAREAMKDPTNKFCILSVVIWQEKTNDKAESQESHCPQGRILLVLRDGGSMMYDGVG